MKLYHVIFFKEERPTYSADVCFPIAIAVHLCPAPATADAWEGEGEQDGNQKKTLC